MKSILVRSLLALMVFCFCVVKSNAMSMAGADTLKCNIKLKMKNLTLYGQTQFPIIRERFQQYKTEIVRLIQQNIRDELKNISDTIDTEHKKGPAANACFVTAEKDYNKSIATLETSECDQSDLSVIQRFDANITLTNKLGRRIIRRLNGDIIRCSSTNRTQFEECMQKHYSNRSNDNVKFLKSVEELQSSIQSISSGDIVFPCLGSLGGKVLQSIKTAYSQALGCIKNIKKPGNIDLFG